MKTVKYTQKKITVNLFWFSLSFCDLLLAEKW